jgi:phosphoribosylformimino-5-aminoimidazole carboxamide ribotide isomerase
VSRDGTLGGPNVALYRGLIERFPWLQVQASGGVSSLEDLRALAAAEIDGVIVGKALLDGRFSFEEALACSRVA